MDKNLDYSIVKDRLEAANVCRRCLLRFFGVNEYTSYKKQNVEKAIQKCLNTNFIPDEEIVDQTDSSDDMGPSRKRALTTPCAACLGILQDVDKMVLEVDCAVNENQHQFQDFVLQFSLPVVIDLRDKLFLLYLEAELGKSYTLKDEDIPSVKEICKWVVGAEYGANTKADFNPFSDFQILLSASYPGTVKECLVLFRNCPEAFPNRRKMKAKVEDIYTKSSILKALDALSSNIKNLYTLPPSPPDKACFFDEILCRHNPVYLGGRYNKYSRELCQTPWILDGNRKMESSVSELITDVVQKHILADKIVFSASGREDVDVKMLGSGRPFVLEIINPRCVKWSIEKMKAIEDEINHNTDLIAVQDLQVISKEDTALLKEGEQMKQKTYSALCVVEKSLKQKDIEYLESLKDLTLHQKTPIRVLHRRTLATRERLLHSMKGRIIDDHHLLLSLETQAGTYIKEFVHSDFGRTTPSLGTLLGTNADILELDVEVHEIHLDWPPKNTSLESMCE